jgi:hypothetical protein
MTALDKRETPGGPGQNWFWRHTILKFEASSVAADLAAFPIRLNSTATHHDKIMKLIEIGCLLRAAI